MTSHISSWRRTVADCVDRSAGCCGRDRCHGKGGGQHAEPAIGGRLDLHPAAGRSDTHAVRAARRRPAAASRNARLREQSAVLRVHGLQYATGAFIGTQHLLRPDIYERGTPPCPQQPGGRVHLQPPKRPLVLPRS